MTFLSFKECTSEYIMSNDILCINQVSKWND